MNILQPTRRKFLGTALALGGVHLLGSRSAAALEFQTEPGAELKLLRWQAFVQGDEALWQENTRKFTDATGVPVSIENIPWPEVHTQALKAAESGQGPDIVLGWFDTPHQIVEHLLPVSDVADHLAQQYGDWYDVCKRYGTHQGQWIALPLGCAGTCVVYRDSHVKAAGFDTFPEDTDGFLKLCQALAENGTPPGLALGTGATGDATVWTHWLLWAFGGKLVDLGGLIVIDSVQTEAALTYARALYQTFVPGTAEWLDGNNNELFLAEEISLTTNGVSIYDAAKRSDDPKLQALAEDIQHANLPVGPIGRPTELYLFTQAMVYSHTQFPNAAKEYLRFMWEREQYEPWQTAASGYITQPLTAYEQNAVWSEDPKLTPYRDCTARMLWNGYAGHLGTASAQALADNIIVTMFARAATGELTPKQAIAEAKQQAAQYYRV